MKFKQIPKEYFKTVLDRLTRFEPAYVRYKRVYDDIITKFCLEYKIHSLSFADELNIVNEIVNCSLTSINTDSILPVVKNLEDKYFAYNEVSYQYLSNSINLKSIFDEISTFDNLPSNLEWLKYIKHNDNIEKLREDNSLLYPIDKVLLCEGETEKVLLNVLLKMFGVDFNKKGILLIPAGGKNQVARKFYSMVEYTKLPIYVLLDKDAMPVKELIDRKIRSKDRIYLINSGEFEDLLPVQIIENTINYIHKNDIHCLVNDFRRDLSMVANIENIYKKYGFGEYKKARFALALKEYIEKSASKEDFIDTEIKLIADFLS